MILLSRVRRLVWFLMAICLYFILLTSLQSQRIGGVKMAWEGEPDKWVLYADDSWEEEVGTLEVRWDDRYDIWDYRVGETVGMIRMKWKDNPNVWELKANNRIITFEVVWKGMLDTWRIRDGRVDLKVQVRDHDFFEEWEIVKSDALGDWAMWTEYQNELGSWIILDELEEDISPEVQMALIFIPILVHFPKG